VELDWDSYKKSKQEISSEQLQLSEEKARTREQTKMRTEEAKTEKMRRVAERKKERQERDERGVKTRKPKQNKENAIVTSRSKLKNRLTKVKKKKTIPWTLQTEQETNLMILWFLHKCLVRFTRRKQVLLKSLL